MKDENDWAQIHRIEALNNIKTLEETKAFLRKKFQLRMGTFNKYD
jgi:hypothetical protein